MYILDVLHAECLSTRCLVVERGGRCQEGTKVGIAGDNDSTCPTGQRSIVKVLHDRRRDRSDGDNVTARQVTVSKTEGFDTDDSRRSIGIARSRIDDGVSTRIVGDRVMSSIAIQDQDISTCATDDCVRTAAGRKRIISRSTIECVVAAVSGKRISKRGACDVFDIGNPIARCIAGARLEVASKVDRNSGSRVGISNRVDPHATIEVVRTGTTVEQIVAPAAVE